MKPKIKLVFYLLTIKYLTAFTQIQRPIFSQELMGTGGTGVAMNSIGVELDNLGQMGFSEQNWIGASFQNNYLLNELSTFQVGAILNHKKINVGFHTHHFGTEGFQMNGFGMGIAKKLNEDFGTGLRLNYQNLNQEYYGQNHFLGVEMGVFYKFTNQLNWAVHWVNPLQMKSLDGKLESFSRLRTGFSYHIENVDLLVDADFANEASIRLGTQYTLKEKIHFRLGYAIPQPSIHSGIGLEIDKLLIDFSYQYHFLLQSSLGIGLRYVFYHK